ncbi:hypothetical protein P4O66_014133, partial [Electrophorus voltai]
DPDLDATPPRAPQLIQQPQASTNPPPYPKPGTSSLTSKLSLYDKPRRQLEAITSTVAHRTRSHTTTRPSAEPEAGCAPQFPMVEVSGPEVLREGLIECRMRPGDSLIITAIAWDCEWAAGVVQLSAKQKSLYSVSHAVPRVSLASAHADPDWQRVGLWTKRVLSATD